MYFILTRLLAVVALAVILIGCSPPPPTVTPTSTPTPPAITPGTSTFRHSFTWETAQDTPELVATLADKPTPQALQTYLAASVVWKDDYSTGTFLSPASVIRDGRTVCTGFARLWQRWAAGRGLRADFVAFWGPGSAHAVAVGRLDGRWRLMSNQFYYSDLDLDPANEGRQSAFIRAASEFYGDAWTLIQVYAEGGQILQQITNDKAPAASIPLSGPRLFTIKR